MSKNMFFLYLQRLHSSRRGGVSESRWASAWKGPGGGQQEGEKTTKRSHTPDDPKGSADVHISVKSIYTVFISYFLETAFSFVQVPHVSYKTRPVICKSADPLGSSGV